MLQPVPFPPPYITLDELRGLLRPGRRMFLPDHVAQTLRDRELLVKQAEAEDIAMILGRLIEELRSRLHEEGFEPPTNQENIDVRMPKRERERADNLALLFALHTTALTTANQPEEAERCGTEGIAWARMAGSHHSRIYLQIALSRLYALTGRRDDEEAVLQAALEAARNSGDTILVVRALNDLIATLISRDRRHRAEELLDEAFDLARTKIPEPWHSLFLPRLLFAKGRMATARKEKGQAINALREALECSAPDRDPLIYASVLSQLGAAYSELGDSQKGLECFSEMTRVSQLSGDPLLSAWGYFRIGELHAVMEDHVQAEKAFRISLEHSPEHYPLPRYYIYFKQSEICLKEKRLEEGIALCNRVLEASPERWSSSFAVAVYIHLGLLEQECDRFTEAEQAFHHSIELCEKTEAVDRSANAKLLLAKLFIKQDKVKEAEAFLGQVIAAERKITSDESIAADAYGILSEIAEKREEFAAALRYKQTQSELEREIARRRTEEALQKQRVLAEVELLEREAQLERERRRRAEQELAQAVFSLKGKNRALENVEKQLHAILSGIVAEKAREITSSLRQMLEEIDTGTGEENHPLNYIHGIDQDFFLRLHTRWPGLTRKQERLCALIRAGLTTQEIASILSVSYEGVRALRKRLRKQLGIESEASLEGVIAEV